MKIYVRKIDEQCITHQISIKKVVWEEFFEKAEEFTAHGLTSNYMERVKILPATDLRFNANIRHVIDAEGNLEVGDIVVIYKDATKYDVELIKPTDSKYDTIQKLCERDQRHGLMLVDGGEAIINEEQNTSLEEANAEEVERLFFQWLKDKGISESSILSYIRHIKLMSKESMEDGVIDKTLFEITDISELNDVASKIRATDKFLNRMEKGKNINSAALNHYIDFVKNYEEPTELEEYNKEMFLNEVFISEEKYDDMVSLLKRKKNIILTGAPGVGKTFMAKRLAYSIMGCKDKSKVEFIQFHQSYSYEEFIEGYRPVETGGFSLEKGLFYNLCKRAEERKDQNFYLIIDEINRGNLSKIFGELLMLIESDKRGDKLTLAYSKESDFSVPSNLYIIGLMNTADRSLALMDYALRRRFSFINIEPAFGTTKFKTEFAKMFDDTYEDALKLIDDINKEIKDDLTLGEGFMIGHSYFCVNKKDGSKATNEDIKNILKYEIKPLIEEYWYDEKETRDKWVNAITDYINR